MKKKEVLIEGIPSIVWGNSSDKVILAVHGNQSNKADIPIEILADIAIQKGYQVISFDLPKHGQRMNQERLCKVVECTKDLTTIIHYVKSKWSHISVFGNSIGAYFSLLAYQDESIEQTLFLSPVVDMQRIIENMMKWFEVDESDLKKQQMIDLPIGQTLYWDYYCYVKEHPIMKWNSPTYILYGDQDEMCELDTILDFQSQFDCNLEIVKNSSHYFHTKAQLSSFKDWLLVCL